MNNSITESLTKKMFERNSQFPNKKFYVGIFVIRFILIVYSVNWLHCGGDSEKRREV